MIIRLVNTISELSCMSLARGNIAQHITGETLVQSYRGAFIVQLNLAGALAFYLHHQSIKLYDIFFYVIQNVLLR